MFKNYLDTQFQGISVEPPLFYNAQFGIRFEIGVQYREIDHPGYFESVYIRSTMIFEEIFNEDDEFWVYIKSYKAAAPYVDFKQGVDVFPKFLKNKELLGKVECNWKSGFFH